MHKAREGGTFPSQSGIGEFGCPRGPHKSEIVSSNLTPATSASTINGNISSLHRGEPRIVLAGKRETRIQKVLFMHLLPPEESSRFPQNLKGANIVVRKELPELWGVTLHGSVYRQDEKTLDPDEFFDKFIEFVESNNWYFGGGFSPEDLNHPE